MSLGMAGGLARTDPRGAAVPCCAAEVGRCGEEGFCHAHACWVGWSASPGPWRSECFRSGSGPGPGLPAVLNLRAQ
ncbi:hypothetical protein NDU88_009375 [Pleurodeles waltl]|uniref:Uncharacterized protein n=1 Tax=Pleurodeles waltl TaxID=8319 RepID=A0AAV7QSG6_PLEWA|nr:hypothetical protein NDU88_009375 [Pleurodeles waltl]